MSHPAGTLLSLLLAACLALASGALLAAGGSGAPDFDGDGFADHIDCNPSDPGINHDAEGDEVADGVDYDCDGIIGLPDDIDGDEVRNFLDCRPLDPTIHPNAADTPNDGIDSNCDGLD